MQDFPFDYTLMPGDTDAQIHWFSSRYNLGARLAVEIKEWCEEQFGPAWASNRWHFTLTLQRFYFRDADDAFAFKMRWG